MEAIGDRAAVPRWRSPHRTPRIGVTAEQDLRRVQGPSLRRDGSDTAALADFVVPKRTSLRSTSSKPAGVLRCRSMTIRSEWSNGEVLAPIEAASWALDTGDVLRWFETAGTDDIVRLAVET